MNRHKKDTAEALVAVREEIGSRVKTVKDLVDDAVVGRMHWQWFGLACFVAGLALATIAPEISIARGYGNSCNQ